MIRSKKVLNHARGQSCQLALPGICNHNPETTVFCHLNGPVFGKGMGLKAHDIAGFFGCAECHIYYDRGHRTLPKIADLALQQALLKAVVNTWVILINDGVIFVPQDAETPASERPVKVRKKPSSRKIPSRPFFTRKTK